MANKGKINLDNFNEIEMVSSTEESAVYRVALPNDSLKKLPIQEKQKIRNQISNTTVRYFDADDLQNLKEIKQQLHLKYLGEKPRRNFFYYLYSLLEI